MDGDPLAAEKAGHRFITRPTLGNASSAEDNIPALERRCPLSAYPKNK